MMIFVDSFWTMIKHKKRACYYTSSLLGQLGLAVSKVFSCASLLCFVFPRAVLAVLPQHARVNVPRPRKVHLHDQEFKMSDRKISDRV